MQRRDFNKAAATTAGVAAAGFGYARSSKPWKTPAPTLSPTPSPTPAPTPAPTPSPTPAPAPAPAPSGLAMGTNLSGMEWARPGLRYGQSTKPNLNYTVPRAADVAWLAANGFAKNRLPVQWELLQPVLSTTPANASVQAILGAPGAFNATYAGYITGVLDAHAAVGAKCIIDLHNYCRYQDFVYQADGSVRGLTVSRDPLIAPYTSDGSQVQVRIFATAAGSTLTTAAFTDFWTRAAKMWMGHPGFGGYGLQNEPHDMPAPGSTVASTGVQDATIWPTFAQAAINAIRAVDTVNPIYLSGNDWQAVWTIGTNNPGWPLQGANLIYDVHMYLDAFSNGFAFDYDTEVAKNYTAGIGSVPIGPTTGSQRLQVAIDWAASRGVKLALTEVGMPVDDPRWQTMFQNAANLARQKGVEVYSWMGGNHWPSRNYAINHVPGWHQGRTLEPTVSGALKAAAGISSAAVFDDGPGYAASGATVTITVYARGYLAAPMTVNVSSSNGGALSKATLTLAAGANSQDTYTFTAPANAVTTLSYSSPSGGQVPPPRRIYSLSDPVSYAAGTSLHDGAMAILAKYQASKWEAGDAYTDFMQGAPAADGQAVRAIADSGFGSSAGNAMEMLNWINTGPNMGGICAPVARTVNGRKTTDHSVYNTFGFWCKKCEPIAGVQPNPRNRVPYDIQDGHFVIAAVSVPGTGNNGLVFQASKTEDNQVAELALVNGAPAARWQDVNGQAVQLTASAVAPAGTPFVLSMSSVPGAQRLRMNTQVVGSAAATLSASPFTQMLIGWGYQGYYPRDGFGGNVYAVVTGRGAPTTSELAVLERFLGVIAGLAL